MLAKPETRMGAFGIHLAISVLIFIALGLVIVFVWYPGFLFQTDGGWQGIQLIAGIDLILGPLLTLIVYKKTKPSLSKDLSVIAIVQLAALSVGCALVYQERPIAVVFAGDKFSTMSRNSFSYYGLDPDNIPLVKNGNKPVWIYANTLSLLPGESEAQAFERLGPEHLRLENYQPFASGIDELANAGMLEIENHKRFEQSDKKRYFKMISRYFEGYLLFDIARARVIETILTNSTDVYGVKQNSE